jgi:hypothetical protein
MVAAYSAFYGSGLLVLLMVAAYSAFYGSGL